MNTETKIAFRQLLSDVLMYMMETGRDRNEILTMLDKLERATEKLISTELAVLLPAHPILYVMGPAVKTEFRLGIAAALDMISKPDCSPAKVLDIIKGQESWVHEQIELSLKNAAGKPRMSVTRLPNKLNPN